MVYLDLVLNLALLVALSIVSNFIVKRWPRNTLSGVILQGLLFGGSAVLGMLRPLNMGPGLIFDGRSVMVSLCALYFGPWAGIISSAMTVACRILIGGAGLLTGILVILSSVLIGLLVRGLLKLEVKSPSSQNLYLFGLAVHLAMLALMITLPDGAGLTVIKRNGLPVILLYPLATILSLTMMFRYTFGKPEVSARIEGAVRKVLAQGHRTGDIALPGEKVAGTRAMGDAVVAALG